MLYLMKFLLTLSLGLNARIAKELPNPYDYQVKAHVRTVALEAEAKYELENGDYYRGMFLRTKPVPCKNNTMIGVFPSLNPLTPRFLEGMYLEIKIDEADKINKQYVYKNIIDCEILKVRSSYNWDTWKDPKFLGGIEINFDTERITTRYQYDTNLDDRHISRFNFEYKYLPKGSYCYYMPNYTIEDHNGVKTWKGGMEVGIDFVELRAYIEKMKKEKENKKEG